MYQGSGHAVVPDCRNSPDKSTPPNNVKAGLFELSQTWKLKIQYAPSQMFFVTVIKRYPPVTLRIRSAAPCWTLSPVSHVAHVSEELTAGLSLGQKTSRVFWSAT
jgi:hypothetical protein